ncbi:MAG: hypothetical protein PGN26_01745 [Xylophilus ampelinus]
MPLREPPTASWRKRAAAFLAALLLASLWGSVAQTQVNLRALTDLGVAIEPGLRLRTTLQDAAFFGPVYAGIVLAAWLPAFAAAAWLARRRPARRAWLYPLAAGAGLLAAVQAADAFAPMPSLIYATRFLPGLLAMAAGSALGGALFAWLTRRPAPPGAPGGGRTGTALPAA